MMTPAKIKLLIPFALGMIFCIISLTNKVDAYTPIRYLNLFGFSTMCYLITVLREEVLRSEAFEYIMWFLCGGMIMMDLYVIIMNVFIVS